MTEIMNMEAFTDKALRETPAKLPQGQLYPKVAILRDNSFLEGAESGGVVVTLINRVRNFIRG